MDLKSDYIDKLIIDNEKIVYFVLKKMNLLNKLDEYYDIALIGLVKSAKTFNPSKGYKFSTYATFVIKNDILQYRRKMTNNKRLVNKLALSIETPIRDGVLIKDIIKDDVDILDDVIRDEQIKLVKSAINKLNRKEKLIIRYYYGLGVKQLDQKQLSKLLNISQSYVSRLHNRALRKLKKEVDKC